MFTREARQRLREGLVSAAYVISEALLVEIERVDADLVNRLAGPLRELAG